MTIELELSELNWVAREEWESVIVSQAAEHVSEIAPLIVGKNAFKIIDVRVADKIIVLDDPNEFLDWVVEVETELVGIVADRFFTSELELLDEVLVTDLSEATTFIGIEVDVINVHSGGIEAQVSESWVGRDDEFAGWAELNVDLDLMVLKGDEGESETNVSVEPELEWNVENA